MIMYFNVLLKLKRSFESSQKSQKQKSVFLEKFLKLKKFKYLLKLCLAYIRFTGH
jgi:hypothetical protein